MAHCDLYIVRKHFDFSCSLDLSSRYPLLDHEANSDYFCRNVLFYNASFTLYLQKTSKHHEIKITRFITWRTLLHSIESSYTWELQNVAIYFSAKNMLNIHSDKKDQIEINYVVTKRIIVLDILSY
jgi:hypothetical protein